MKLQVDHHTMVLLEKKGLVRRVPDTNPLQWLPTEELRLLFSPCRICGEIVDASEPFRFGLEFDKTTSCDKTIIAHVRCTP